MRFLTAGESHGPELIVVVDGFPAGVRVSEKVVNVDLSRRQKGYGRGGRMAIERDTVTFKAGLRQGVTTGAPIAMVIVNKDHPSWEGRLSLTEPDTEPPMTRPRPGHADLAGGMKFGHRDLRNVLERASARETAARCLAGSLAKILLMELGVTIISFVRAVGGIKLPAGYPTDSLSLAQVDADPMRCPDPTVSKEIMVEIDRAKDAGETLGGVFEVIVSGMVPGLGSYTHWDRRLDAGLGAAVLSIPSVKAVSIGDGIEVASLPGSKAHDPIVYGQKKWSRQGNRAGGIEGGVSNGQPIVIRGYVKPIPTLPTPLSSVDIETKQEVKAAVERSDICVVPAAAVIAEAMVAWVLAESYREKLGGDTLEEMGRALRAYRDDLAAY